MLFTLNTSQSNTDMRYGCRIYVTARRQTQAVGPVRIPEIAVYYANVWGPRFVMVPLQTKTIQDIGLLILSSRILLYIKLNAFISNSHD